MLKPSFTSVKHGISRHFVPLIILTMNCVHSLEVMRPAAYGGKRRKLQRKNQETYNLFREKSLNLRIEVPETNL